MKVPIHVSENGVHRREMVINVNVLLDVLSDNAIVINKMQVKYKHFAF